MAFHALIAHLNRSGALNEIIITNSHYQSQPLWMRGLPQKRFTSHMVWYSQNSIPFVYKANGIRTGLPDHRHIEVDHIWVWTEGFKAYLEAQGVRGRVHAVGPIIWQLSEPNQPRAAKGRFTFVVFDVTPVSTEVLDRIGLPRSAYYYRTENVRKFLLDILDVRDELAAQFGLEISVVLKHKRTPTKFHESDYLEMVAQLTRSGAIEIVPPDSNLYALIGGATVVLVIPFSSPAYVASSLNVAAVYYDPTGELDASQEGREAVHFSSGKHALRTLARGLLTDILQTSGASAKAISTDSRRDWQ